MEQQSCLACVPGTQIAKPNRKDNSPLSLLREPKIGAALILLASEAAGAVAGLARALLINKAWGGQEAGQPASASC